MRGSSPQIVEFATDSQHIFVSETRVNHGVEARCNSGPLGDDVELGQHILRLLAVIP